MPPFPTRLIMTRRDPDDPRAYDRARAAFDELSSEDQARFLLEVTAAGVSRGATRISRTLADELENVFGGSGGSGGGSSASRSSRRRPGAQHDSGEPHDEPRGGPGPAEPPTGAQRSA